MSNFLKTGVLARDSSTTQIGCSLETFVFNKVFQTPPFRELFYLSEFFEGFPILNDPEQIKFPIMTKSIHSFNLLKKDIK
jgi:hypothetical protein